MNRQVKRISLLAFGFFLWGVRVEASAQDVILKTEENKVEVTMGALEEDALSMQLTLDVRVTEGDPDAKISFEFDPGIAGSVKQCRYDQNTGTLSLYISGNRQQKLSSGREFHIGKVVLDAGSGTAAATVDVKPGGLQIVNDAYGLYSFAELNASPAQKVTVGGQETDTPGSEGESPPGVQEPSDPQGPSDPADASGGDESVSGSSSAGAASNAPAGSTAFVPSDGTAARKDVGIRTGSSRKVSGETTDGPDSRPEETQEETADEAEPDRETEADPVQGGEGENAQDPISGQWKTVPEKTKDLLLLAVLAAAGIAAGLVIFLMAQEYERKKKARRRRNKRAGQGRRTSRRKKKKRTTKNQP